MTPSRAARRRAWATLAVPLLVYFAATVVFSWPLAISLASRLGAPEGPGDPYLNLWILGWDLHVLSTHPAWLVTGRVFEANIFYPAAHTLAYSDHLLPQALALLPLYLASGDVVLCYNALLLASLAASGLAMHALARGIGCREPGCYAAGIAWAFWPYHVSHLIHLQLQSLYVLPLALLALCRLTARPRWRDAVALGGLAALQAASSLYYGVMTALVLCVAAAGLGWWTGRLRQRAWITHLAGAAVLGAVLVAPFVWPYWQVEQDEGFARNLYEASRHEAVAHSFLQVPDLNRLYGRTHLLTARDAAGGLRAHRQEGVEDGLFPGALLLALGIAGLIGGWRGPHRGLLGVAAAVAVLGFVLSLGPDGVRPVYAAAHHLIFGFQAIRAPARFGVLVAFGLAIAAAFGADAVASRRGALLAGALVAGMFVEYASMPWPLVARPAIRTAVGQWLAAVPGAGAVVYLPVTNDRHDTIAMVDSLQYDRPLVNGASGQRPAFYPALVDALHPFPTADALWALHDFNVRFVVAPGPLAGAVTAQQAARGLLPLADTPLVERARLRDSVIYELVWTDATDARLRRPAPPPPPPTGPIPFDVGEAASYTIQWAGGRLDLPAGTARLSVEAGPSADLPYRFVVAADTAPWVSSFFEAHDRFETIATPGLLPTWHLRRLQEGRRAIEREMRFDQADGRVAVGPPGADGLSFHIPAGTRDPLTALYYIRTQPLQPGTRVTLPVTDNGRTYLVTVDVAAREPASIGGRTVEAIRLELQIAERVARRTPILATAWVTTDPGHAVVAADVRAGFGRIHLERIASR